MSDQDDLMDEATEAAEAMEAGDEHPAEDFVHGEDAVAAEHAEALAEARAERLARQAFLFGVDKQLFTFLFANCLFVAGALASWGRGPIWEDGVSFRSGLDSIRGGLIFGLGIYGFWTAYFNIYGGQMKVWPYLLNALLGLWAGLGGIMGAFNGDARGAGGEMLNTWAGAGEYLKTPGLKKMLLDDIMVRMSTFSPGHVLVAVGGVMVLWVILSGLKKGASSAKAAPAGGRSRRR